MSSFCQKYCLEEVIADAHDAHPNDVVSAISSWHSRDHADMVILIVIWTLTCSASSSIVDANGLHDHRSDLIGYVRSASATESESHFWRYSCGDDMSYDDGWVFRHHPHGVCACFYAHHGLYPRCDGDDDGVCVCTLSIAARPPDRSPSKSDDVS